MLRERFVPSDQKSPGFVAAYWTYGQRTGMLVFDSEEAARSMMANVQQNSAGQAKVGLQLGTITVTAVLAAAHRP